MHAYLPHGHVCPSMKITLTSEVVVWDIFFDVIRFGGQITIIYLLWLLLAGWLFRGL